MTAPELDPVALLDLADELLTRTDSAAIRSACDRAYYGALLFARDQLDDRGLATPYRNSQDHKYIPNQLKAQPGGYGVGNDLRRLGNARRKYTYETGTLGSTGIPVESPAWVMSTARSVVGFVEAIGT